MSVIVWLIVALVAGIIEASTVTLVSVWFAAGAVCSAVAAGFGASIALQIGIFVVVSALLLVITLPLCKKVRNSEKQPTNADMLIGCTAVVTEAVDPIQGAGAVKVRGQIWSARGLNDEKIDVGTEVIVEKISGVHLVVSVPEN